MAEIMDRLRQDHVNMGRLLDMFDGQAAAMARGEEMDRKKVSNALVYCLSYPDLFHHPVEDKIYRRMLARGASADQIGDLERAHEELSALTRRLSHKMLEEEDSADGRKVLQSLLKSFVSAYRLHIEAEEKVFFPQAEEILFAADWAAVEAEMEQCADPLFGDSGNLSHAAL